MPSGTTIGVRVGRPLVEEVGFITGEVSCFVIGRVVGRCLGLVVRILGFGVNF